MSSNKINQEKLQTIIDTLQTWNPAELTTLFFAIGQAVAAEHPREFTLAVEYAVRQQILFGETDQEEDPQIPDLVDCLQKAISNAELSEPEEN